MTIVQVCSSKLILTSSFEEHSQVTELRQREPRVECPAFLAFVRRKPCCNCGAPPRSQAAHIRMASAMFGKRGIGMAEKPSDRWCVALCHDCHLDGPGAQHRIGEQAFWKAAGLNPFVIATTLWAQFCRRKGRSPEQRERVVKRAKRRMTFTSAKASRLQNLSTGVKRFTDSRPKPRAEKRKWPMRKLQGRGFR
jgi:hypothetical protein